MKRALFIFHRDLRCHDNVALIQACKKAEEVLPIFIFDPEQVEKNEYFAVNAFKFLLESLEDLVQQLGGNLQVFYGNPLNVLQEIRQELAFDAIFFTTDYTPFARSRDAAVCEWARGEEISCQMYEGLLLNSVKKTLKADGTPYTIFTPFYKNARQFVVSKPQELIEQKICTQKIGSRVRIEDVGSKVARKYAEESVCSGGRTEGLIQLERFIEERVSQYEKGRDIPSLNATSLLSAHLKFGTLSPREVFWRVDSISNQKARDIFISELYWRDFFTQIGFYFPHVFEGEKNFRKMYDSLEWNNSEQKFCTWCNGHTGYPIVDAGMRELNRTGFMHNRVRMIVASFLVKDLRIDWKWGERYFAEHLVDYDPAVNNGNWQWAASTGCDAQPYFRIFNPWRQLERFDPDCEYIKKWIPELRSCTAKEIKDLEKGIGLDGYVGLIVDHKVAVVKTKEMYAVCRVRNTD